MALELLLLLTCEVIIDLVLRGWPVRAEAITSASRGLVGDTTFGVLPEITPTHCFVITAALSAVSDYMRQMLHPFA
jgi:hypothetical protein